jgi:mRNA interferase RelE/StbE
MDTHEAYIVTFTEAALKSLRRYPQNDQRRILDRIDVLAKNPQGMTNVKRLIEAQATYRLRVGDYRVLFERDDIIRVIDVLNILPRGRAYRR